jgi:ribosomal protein L37E
MSKNKKRNSGKGGTHKVCPVCGNKSLKDSGKCAICDFDYE